MRSHSHRRQFRPACEPLEGRALLSTIEFSYTLNDPAHQFDQYPVLTAAIPIAQRELSGLFQGSGSIAVEIAPTQLPIYADGSPTRDVPDVSLIGRGVLDGKVVVEPIAEFEANTGAYPFGSESAISIEAGVAALAQLPNDYLGSVTLATVIEHETLHGMGFYGYRTTEGAGYGMISSGYESVYDSLTAFGAGGDASVLYFTGPTAEAVYGGPVPLTSLGPAPAVDENFYHVGNPGSELASDDLMSGLGTPSNTLMTPTKLDLAMLTDMGWHVVGTPASTPLKLDPPQVTVQSVTVQELQPEKGKQTDRAIVLQFSGALDPAAAQSLGCYGLAQTTGRGRRARTKPVALSRASYDPANNTVTLFTRKPLVLRQPLTLSISGLYDEFGRLVNSGQPVRLVLQK